VHVAPIKPKLKPPGTTSKRLKLEHENLLPNFDFKFNLRRYIMDVVNQTGVDVNAAVGQCRLNL
jgi:hypothetical protein